MAQHIYHYNMSGEQRYFLGEQRRLFNAIAMNGNIVSHTPAGVAGFIATINKSFYIDPQTHAFQHSTDKIKRDVSDKKKGEEKRFEFKPSIVKLAQEHLKGPFARVIKTDEPVTPDDFIDAKGVIDRETVASICQSVVDFQMSTLSESLKPDDKEFMNDGSFVPAFVLSPYFYLSGKDFGRWAEINDACYAATVEQNRDQDVFYKLVISRYVLEHASEDILESVAALKPQGILLWIDDHAEEKLSVGEIATYIDFLQGLRKHTQKLLCSHGGYLSTLLCHKEVGALLDGVGHSINYGESRLVVPVGGGIPMARFYLPAAHSRLRFADALDIVLTMRWDADPKTYTEHVCGCKQCRELFMQNSSVDLALNTYGESFVRTIVRRDGSRVSREFPTASAKKAASMHYLQNKAKEFDDLEQIPFGKLLEGVDQSFKSISAKCGFEHVAHLSNWYQVLAMKYPSV